MSRDMIPILVPLRYSIYKYNFYVHTHIHLMYSIEKSQMFIKQMFFLTYL